MAVFINEFHYDNAGTDTGEFVELAGTAGQSLTGWQLVRYNGTNPAAAAVYTSPGTISLGGTFTDESNGFGFLSFSLPTDGLQNGGNDGFALVDAMGGVVQLLSYEGTFTAAGGPAAGQTSTDIGVAEGTTTPIGSSLTLVGTGDEYADFTWAVASDDTPGEVNGGQTFTGGGGGETVSIADATITEGDAGTQVLTFTVTRSGNAGAFDVDFDTADGTATEADDDYEAASGTLSFTAGGALSQSISVTINGDAVTEPDEAFDVLLSGLANTTGTTTVADASATGTIVNDDVSLTPIYDIQGAGHKSPFVGGAPGAFGNSGAVRVTTEGVVTAIAANGFYLQDVAGDGDTATSDGILVFTGGAPDATITVGETVRVTGRVDEFRPGGSGGSNNLTITEISVAASVGGTSVVELGGNTVLAPVVLGAGRVPPFARIDNDGLTSFDPNTDGIDFFESLEGMLVELPTPTVIAPTAEFRTRDPANSANAEGPPNQEIWVRVPNGFDPDSLTPRGGLILGETDANPERIQIDDIDPAIDLPDVDVGAVLETVRGVVHYDFANYEVLVSERPMVQTNSPLLKETTPILRDLRQITVGDYNVENLDPEVEDTAAGSVNGGDLYARLGESDDDVGSGQYATIAAHIARNLRAPTIVALQEVQDNDGAEISGDVDSTETLQLLSDTIFDAYGIRYAFAFENPPGSNQDGGQPNANIRPAFLYRADQVSLVDTIRLTDPNPGESDGFAGDDFASSRKPLVGLFDFNGVRLTIVNNHLNSKGGDNALFGNAQPPVLSSELQRIEQAEIVNAYVDGLLASDPNARVMVVGDINDFEWSIPFDALTGRTDNDVVLTDLAEALLPPNERYSYNFQGNAQALDHQLVSEALLNQAAPAFDEVHVNSEFADQASDHDPSLSRFDFTAFGERISLTNGNDTIDGAGGNDRLFGLNGNDLLLGGAGNDSLYGGTRNDTLVGGAGNDRLAGDLAADVYVFAPGSGRDIIYTFENGVDRIDLSGYGVTRFDQLNIGTSSGGDATIRFSSADNFRIDGITPGQLDASDFIFA